jgi:hypothetical protein
MPALFTTTLTSCAISAARHRSGGRDVELRRDHARVVGVHVAYVDTDMCAGTASTPR